jgi:hypothetical protein
MALKTQGALDTCNPLPQRRLRVVRMPMRGDGRHDGCGARKQGLRSLTTEELQSVSFRGHRTAAPLKRDAIGSCGPPRRSFRGHRTAAPLKHVDKPLVLNSINAHSAVIGPRPH